MGQGLRQGCILCQLLSQARLFEILVYLPRSCTYNSITPIFLNSSLISLQNDLKVLIQHLNICLTPHALHEEVSFEVS